MKKEINYEHRSLLGNIKVKANFNVSDDGTETLSYNEIIRIERIAAYKFYLKAVKKDLLSPQEIKGIIYFLGVNMNKLASFLKIDRGTLSNVIKNRKPSKLLCHTLLEAVEKELLFPNYFKAKFEKAIECRLDKHYYELLITKNAA